MRPYIRPLLFAAAVLFLSSLLLPAGSAMLRGAGLAEGVGSPRPEAALAAPARASILAPQLDEKSADLGVTKAGQPETVNPGEDLTYTIQLTNSGPDSAQNATLDDNIPAGTTFVSLSAPAGWSCTTPTAGDVGAVNCSNANFAMGSATFTLVVKVDQSATPGTFITNTATASAGTPDPNDENNSATTSSVVASSGADLGVSKSAGSETVVAGRDVSYTIQVTNGGPAAADASLIDTLPGTMTFVSLSAPADWSCTTPAVGAGGTVTCTNASFAARTVATFTLVGNVPAGTQKGTTFQNTAVVGSNTPDPNDENNSGTFTFTVEDCIADAAVTTNADSGSGSLRQAIQDVCAGGTVFFDMNQVVSPITLTGGELLLDKNLTIRGPNAAGLTVSGNNSSRVFNVAAKATVVISDLTITGGRANSGGGVYNLGDLTLSNVTLTGNTAAGGAGEGGALAGEGGTLFVVNSTVSGNSAETNGGGLVNRSTSAATLVNVTVTDNRSDSDNNGTGDGGGIAHLGSGPVALRNTIVAGNFKGAGSTASDFFVLSGSPVDSGSANNLIGVDTGLAGIANGSNGNQVGTAASPVNALLGPLADNGGPTRTHLPLPGSPAVNNGSNALANDRSNNALTTDQRGLPRVVGASVDVGSVEVNYSFNATAGTPQSATVNTDFATQLQATLTESGRAVPGVTVTFSAPGAGPSGVFPSGNTAVTDASGRASVPIRANTVAGGYSVTAAAGPLSATFSLTNTPGAPASVAPFAGTPQSTTVNTSFPVQLQARVADAFGNPLAGVAVTFSAPASGASGTFAGGSTSVSVNTDAGGIATAPVFTANTTAGTYNVTASASGVASPAVFSLTNTPGAPASVTPFAGTPQSATVNTSFPVQLQAKVVDAFNNPVSGVAVTFSAPTTGAGGTFPGGLTSVIVNTDAGGVATAPVFTANTTAGSYNVAAGVSGVVSRANFSLTNTPGAPASITPLAGGGQSAGPGATFPVQLKARVADAFGNAVSGVAVTFSAPASGAGGTFPGGLTSVAVNTDASGIATAPVFTANTTAGTYNVTAAVGGVASPASFSLTNLPPGVIQFASAAFQGDEGGGTAVINVTRTGGSAGAVSVNFSTSDGTAGGGDSCAAGADFVAASGTLTWPDGDSSDKTFTVTVCDDSLNEPDEAVGLSLSGPTGHAALGPQATAALTIRDDDPRGGIFEFATSVFAVAERGGQRSGIAVRRTGDTTRAATVEYSTDDGSVPSVAVPCSATTGAALQRCDYTHTAGTLRFAAGETFKSFSVPVNDDSYAEGPETTRLVLSNPGGGAVLGAQSAATLQIDDDFTESPGNPIDDDRNFVRQHYHDFLNREPDAAGWDFWTDGITSCGSDAACREVKRVDTSAAFFLSIEFQETGYFVYLARKAAFGDLPGAPVPVRFREFLHDTQAVGRGVAVGQGAWEQQLEANRQAFLLSIVRSDDFRAQYPDRTPAVAFVNLLDANAGRVLTSSEREALTGELSQNPSDASLRASVLRKVASHPVLVQRDFNRAFVLMQYFGYLRRDPDAAPDSDFSGYRFWLAKLDEFGGDYRRAEMVKAFIRSAEYRQRFGQ